MTDPLAFTAAVLALLATPGPTNTLLATSGATVGARRSLWLLPAELAGYLTSIAALMFVLGPEIAARPALGRGLRLGSAACIALIGWRLWRGARNPVDQPRPVSARHVFVTTLVNPKALAFAFAIFPPFERGALASVAPYFAGFSLIVVAVAMGWLTLGAALGARAAPAIRAGTSARVGAIVLAGFAAVLSASVIAWR